MSANYSHTTRAVGSTLTAAIYNGDHNNHITNGTPGGLDDYSLNASQMQTTTDPYPAAVVSLPTSLAGELERMRYVIEQITGKANWYIDPDVSLTAVSAKNLLINGGFSLAQRGTSFTAATTITNDDDAYLLDRWLLLSDGNDIVDVTQQSGGGVSGTEDFIRLDVESISKKFGILQIIENSNLKNIIGGSDVVSLSFEAKVTDITKLSDIRAVVLSWDSTADTVTSDIVSAWNAEGTRPTLVANWTAENTDSNLGVTASWVRYTIENIPIDTASTTNVGVFIYQNNVATSDTAAIFLDITNVQLSPGAVASVFQYNDIGSELSKAQRYFEILNGDAVVSSMFGICQALTGTDAQGPLAFIPKRVIPTITVSAAGDFDLYQAGGGREAVTVFTFAVENTQNAVMVLTVAANIAAGNATCLVDDTGGSSRIYIDSEL